MTAGRRESRIDAGLLVGSFVKETLMRFKVAIGLSVVVASIALMGTSRAGDPVDSGLKIGDSVSPFLVDDITGPNKGKTLCYR